MELWPCAWPSTSSQRAFVRLIRTLGLDLLESLTACQHMHRFGLNRGPVSLLPWPTGRSLKFHMPRRRRVPRRPCKSARSLRLGGMAGREGRLDELVLVLLQHQPAQQPDLPQRKWGGKHTRSWWQWEPQWGAAA